MAFRSRAESSVFNQDPEELKQKLKTTTMESIIGDPSTLPPKEADEEFDNIIQTAYRSRAFKEWSKSIAVPHILVFFQEMLELVSIGRLKAHALICSRLFDIEHLLRPIEFQSDRILETEEIIEQLSEDQLTGLWYKYDSKTVAEAQYLYQLKNEMRD